MLNKAKGEFITQAIETLRKEIENKNIDIKGQTISAPEDSNENEREEIVLNKIVEDYDKIVEKYEPYLSGQLTGSDPETVERMEKMKKFILSLGKISILMKYSRLCDEWMNDVSMEVTIDNPSEILSKTIHGSSERKELINFVLANKEIIENQIFTNQELKAFSQAVSK